MLAGDLAHLAADAQAAVPGVQAREVRREPVALAPAEPADDPARSGARSATAAGVTAADVATAEVPVGPAGVATRAAVPTGSTFMIVVPVLLPLAPPRSPSPATRGLFIGDRGNRQHIACSRTAVICFHARGRSVAAETALSLT